MRRDLRRSVWAAVLAGLRAMAGPTLPLPAARSLSHCPACGRDRIAILTRSHYREDLDRLRLRCGECALERDIVMSPREVDALVAMHAAHRAEIEDALASLRREKVLVVPTREKES